MRLKCVGKTTVHYANSLERTLCGKKGKGLHVTTDTDVVNCEECYEKLIEVEVDTWSLMTKKEMGNLNDIVHHACNELCKGNLSNPAKEKKVGVGDIDCHRCPMMKIIDRLEE